jgi:Tol biopolymer transport system component
MTSQPPSSRTRTALAAIATGSLTGALLLPAGAAHAAAPVQGNNGSHEPSTSADGRYVAFSSDASNLVVGDTNTASDVFVRDRTTSTTARVSVSSAGQQGNSGSAKPAVSADGRYVAFVSLASNLVPGDTNGVPDVFVRDRSTGQTTRVSVSSAEAQGDDESNFETPAISADGRYVAFSSYASNLVGPGKDYPYSSDVFLRDRDRGVTTRVSVDATGAPLPDTHQPSISSDGQVVGFVSRHEAPDSPRVTSAYVRDRAAGRTVLVGDDRAACGGGTFDPQVSADGRFFLRLLWRNGCARQVGLLVRTDWQSVTSVRRVVWHDTSPGNFPIQASQSANGSRAVYADRGSRPGAPVVLYDWSSGQSTVLPLGQTDARDLDLSADGRSVALETDESLTADDTNAPIEDVYVWTPDQNRVRRVSVG